MHPYSSIDVTAAWKKLRFILSVRSDFHIIDSLLIAVHAFVNLVSMSFSVDSTLLPRYIYIYIYLYIYIYFILYIYIYIYIYKKSVFIWTKPNEFRHYCVFFKSLIKLQRVTATGVKNHWLPNLKCLKWTPIVCKNKRGEINISRWTKLCSIQHTLQINTK